MNLIDQPEMTAQDALALVQLFDQNQLVVTIDGGWGVDALLGEQTRAHSDLDIVINYQDVPRLRGLLEAHGYQDVPRPDTRTYNFVMGDNRRHLVDIHTYTLDRINHPEQGQDYPLDALDGAGMILGHPVRCIPPETMVEFHTGYNLDEKDYHDVKALCQHFGINIPAEFEKFTHKLDEYPSIEIEEDE